MTRVIKSKHVRYSRCAVSRRRESEIFEIEHMFSYAAYTEHQYISNADIAKISVATNSSYTKFTSRSRFSRAADI